MITTIYALKDTKVSFQQPFLQSNRAQAIRTAEWLANDKKEREVEDLELWELGQFNDENGIIIGKQPEFVVKLIDLRKKAAE